MLGFLINLLAAFSYLARVISNQTCSSGLKLFTQAHYLEYTATCPFIVLDLLWNFEAPFKWYAAVFASPPPPPPPPPLIPSAKQTPSYSPRARPIAS